MYHCRKVPRSICFELVLLDLMTSLLQTTFEITVGKTRTFLFSLHCIYSKLICFIPKSAVLIRICLNQAKGVIQYNRCWKNNYIIRNNCFTLGYWLLFLCCLKKQTKPTYLRWYHDKTIRRIRNYSIQINLGGLFSSNYIHPEAPITLTPLSQICSRNRGKNIENLYNR